VLEVVDIFDNVIKVRRIDMFDGTPVLDIKPYIEYKPYENRHIVLLNGAKNDKRRRKLLKK